MISEIHTKGHHSVDRNLRYVSEYIYWPVMQKDFMGPFTKLKGQDSVLVVVDIAVGSSWLIPTSVTATAVQTTELLQPIFLRLMEYPPRLSAMLTHDSPLSSGNRHLS